MIKTITLNRGDELLIDSDDYDFVSNFHWTSNNGYVFRSERFEGGFKRIYLHRELMGAPNNKVVDHINGNPLDNRRENLRVCDAKENAQNRQKFSSKVTSRYKGVRKRKDHFESEIKSDGVTYYLGTFATEIEAAIVYNIKAKELFGEYAKLNEIPDEYVGTIPKPVEQSSKYRGVMFHKRIGKWQASIQYAKQRHHLGYFDTELEAALAYNDKAIEIHGDRAKLNEI